MTLLRNPLVNPSPIATRIEWSPVFEMLIASWATVVEADDLDSFADRERLEGLVSDTGLSEEDAAWMGDRHGTPWVVVLHFIDRARANSLGALVEFIDETDEAELYSVYEPMTGKCEEYCDHPVGDVPDAETFKSRLVSVLRSADANLGDSLEAFIPTLRHDAEGTRFLQRRASLEKLIETVTNGIAFSPEAGVEEIVLIPSVVLRPFNLLFRHDRTQYLLYSASDEAIEADADTPPSWMVQMFKALGDEKRLRLLRHLASGPKTLGELVEYIGMAKSTTHHHLRLLRAAGLVRQSLSGHKEEGTYELRTNLLPEAVSLVGQYISPEETS